MLMNFNACDGPVFTNMGLCSCSQSVQPPRRGGIQKKQRTLLRTCRHEDFKQGKHGTRREKGNRRKLDIEAISNRTVVMQGRARGNRLKPNHRGCGCDEFVSLGLRLPFSPSVVGFHVSHVGPPFTHAPAI